LRLTRNRDHNRNRRRIAINMATQIYPNRNVELIAWNIAVSCIVIFFVFWRVLVRFQINRRLWLSDYLMAIASVRRILLEPLLTAYGC